MRAVIERTVLGNLSNADLLAEAEQVPGFTESLRAHLRANPESVQGRPLNLLLGHIHRNCAWVDLSLYGNLSFDDILAIIEIVAASGDMFSLTLPDLEDLTATNLRRVLSSGLVHELRLRKHQVGGLEQFLNAIDGTSVAKFNVPELYPRSFAPVDLGRVSSQWEYEQFGAFRPWKSPSPSLPRPKQFPITQLVFAQSPASRTPPTQSRRTLRELGRALV
jgi:hypothetical protein